MACHVVFLPGWTGYTLCWIGMDRLGRRFTFVAATVLGGVGIMVSGLIPNGQSPRLARTALYWRCQLVSR